MSKKAKRPYRVGKLTWPQPGDDSFETRESAEAAAEVLAARDPHEAIAVWDVDDEIVVMFFAGEEFVKRYQ